MSKQSVVNAVGRLERLPVTPYTYLILALVGIGFTVETMDTTFTGLISDILRTDWHLSLGEVGLLGSSGPIGYLFGAGIGGGLSDKFGRRNVFLWTLVGLSIFSALRALTPHGDWPLLGFLTAVSWFFSGAETAVGTIYMNELAPTAKRGRLTGWATGSYAFGLVLGTALSLTLPYVGWRGLLLYTGVTALTGAIFRPFLPESPRWLEAKGLYDKAEKSLEKLESATLKYVGTLPPASIIEVQPQKQVPFFLLFSNQFRKRTIMSWIAFFGQTAAYYGFYTWIYVLLSLKGYTIEHSIVVVLIAYILGALPGNMIAPRLADTRLGRKRTVYIYLVGGALSAVGLAFAPSAIYVAVFLTLFVGFLNGAYPSIYLYVAEQYPTLARNTGLGSASAFSRIGAILMPIVFASLYPIGGFAGVFLLAGIMMAMGGAVIFAFGTESRGVLLEKLSEKDVSIKGP